MDILKGKKRVQCTLLPLANFLRFYKKTPPALRLCPYGRALTVTDSILDSSSLCILFFSFFLRTFKWYLSMSHGKKHVWCIISNVETIMHNVWCVMYCVLWIMNHRLCVTYCISHHVCILYHMLCIEYCPAYGISYLSHLTYHMLEVLYVGHHVSWINTYIYAS